MTRTRISVQTEAAHYELDLQVDDDVRPLMLDVDKDAFVQIMINLLDNAIKYSAGAARARVEIGAKPAGNNVVICVRDFGPGVPREKMKKLFEPFYRHGDARTGSVQGTGIGLSVVRELAARMGGDVEVRNREPGAEFLITLPGHR